MRIRVNLPEGKTYAGQGYVVVEAHNHTQARRTAAIAAKVPEALVGPSFTHGYIGYKNEPGSNIEYRHHVGPGSWFQTWVPEGEEFADTPDERPVDG